MNLPNKLTLARFVLTVFFLAALFWRAPFNDTAALVLFCVAILTDYYDGKIARRDKLITNFGTLMDPAALRETMLGIVGLSRAELTLVLVLILFLFAANKILPSMSGLAQGIK